MWEVKEHDVPMPAWAVIQGSLRYKITPQMFNMQRIYGTTIIDRIEQFNTIYVHYKCLILMQEAVCPSYCKVESNGVEVWVVDGRPDR